MGAWRRVGSVGGLWTLAGLLTVVAVVVAAAAGPATTRLQDRALHQRLDSAPYTVRDIIATRQAAADPGLTAEQMRDDVLALLPAELADNVEVSWGYQRTQVSTGWAGGPVLGGALTGPGVTSAPERVAPVVSFHYRSELEAEVSVVAGHRPDTGSVDVIEVLVEAGVADTLGVTVGGEYALHPGRVRVPPDPAVPAPLPGQPVVRVTGLFIAQDPAAPAWDHPVGLPLATETVVVPPEDDPKRVLHAGLVTDAAGFAALAGPHLASQFRPQTGARVRLDVQRLDAAWAGDGVQAVRALQADPRLRGATARTGLIDALEDYRRQAATVRALAALTAAGLVGAAVGLLALVTWLMVDRRRDELGLLRARGAALHAVGFRLATEALPVVLTATVAGWLSYPVAVQAAAGSPPPGAPGPPPVSTGGVLLAGVTALVALLAVPVASAWVVRRSGLAEHQQAEHRQVPGPQRTSVRWMVEALVLVCASLGVVLAWRRGLTVAGVDPYLSAVPLLLALAGGLVALRIYRAPVRAATRMARRLRGVVGFLALARIGRAAPTASWALLVLVLAVATAAFASVVHQGMGQARDAGALQRVGAHVRISGADLPGEAIEAVAAASTVDAVASAHRGIAATAGKPLTGPVVVAVNPAEYQRLLDSLGLDLRLDELLSHAEADGPVPILAGAGVADRDALSVRFAGVDYPARVVGEVPDGVPVLGGDRDWVLVPANALAPALPVDDLLVSGADADPDAIHAAVARSAGSDLSVDSFRAARAELEQTGFNPALTVAFVVGGAGGVAAAVLAVAIWLVGTAAERGRQLSLLRTMGMSEGQAGRLLWSECAPAITLAVLAGVVCGIATPLLLAPALDLETLTGGRPLPVLVVPTVAITTALVAALLLVASTTQSVVNRRRGLGRVLRVS